MPAITLHKWFINSPGGRLERVQGTTYFLPDITDMVTDSTAVPVNGHLEIQLICHSPQAIELYERWEDQTSQCKPWTIKIVDIYKNSMRYHIADVVADDADADEEPDFSLTLI